VTRAAPPILAAAALLLASPAPADEGRAKALQEVLELYNTHARFPLPVPRGSDLRRLAGGSVLKIRDKSAGPDAPHRAVGMLASSASVEDLWVSALDGHFVLVEELTEVRLTDAREAPARWYQHLDLPWPFHDRHWVIDVHDRIELATASDNRCWEHYWELSPDGEAIAAEAVAAGRVPNIGPEDVAEDIYTPVNRGAWAVLDAGELRLLVYHVTSVIGGNVPDKAVLDYGLLTLDSMLRRVERRTHGVIAEHYRDDHVPFRTGDGTLLPVPQSTP
jgi:hypothetical protein